ncbi:MAG: nitronate monooxygenase, partial [Jatrophihabitantaceae bacterium]
LVEHLEHSTRAAGLYYAARNAAKFKKLTGLSWKDMITEGLATKHGKEQTWSQMIMAANTPMLLRAGLVEGREDAGVLASGQVVGMLDDLPSVHDLISDIVAEAEKIIARLGTVVS